MNNKISEQLKDIFAGLFNMDRNLVTKDSSPDSISSWDSLQHLNLVTSIEESFGIQLEDQDIVEMLSFALIEKIVEEKISRS